MEIGNILREARQAKGYSLADAEEATKIRARYLEALENEQFEILPGQVYVIAFLRNYARFLGLDDNQLVQQYKEMGTSSDISEYDHEDENTTLQASSTPDRRIRRRSKRRVSYWPFVAVAALLAVALGIGYAFKSLPPQADTEQPQVAGQQQESEQQQSPDVENDRQDQTNEGPEATSPDPQKQTSPVELVLNVTDANCWMKIDVDGQTAFEGIVTPGNVKEFSGQERINVVLGNAGAVEVQYNGENIGKLGANGSIAKREFTPQEG